MEVWRPESLLIHCNAPGITVQDCVEAPNGVALCYAFRTDNSGPPISTDEVIRDLDFVRTQFPQVPMNAVILTVNHVQAQVFASTYDAFISDILPIRDQLPVITTEFGVALLDSSTALLTL